MSQFDWKRAGGITLKWQVNDLHMTEEEKHLKGGKTHYHQCFDHYINLCRAEKQTEP